MTELIVIQEPGIT